MPSYSHVAITKLLDEGVVKFIVSSNHDNLHIRSGASPDKVSEIFGNGYIETCLKCGDKFLRHTQVPQLGRICDHVRVVMQWCVLWCVLRVVLCCVCVFSHALLISGNLWCRCLCRKSVADG